MSATPLTGIKILEFSHSTEHRGGCHCGYLRLSLRLSQALANTPSRACGCAFCRAHYTHNDQ